MDCRRAGVMLFVNVKKFTKAIEVSNILILADAFHSN